MNELFLKCSDCNKVFPSGFIAISKKPCFFKNCQSQCRFCGSMENIPDGTFRSTVEGFVKVLEIVDDPLGKAKELLNELQKSRTSGDLLKIQKSQNFTEFKKWLPDSPEKIAAYIAIIYTVVQILTKDPVQNFEYNTFVNQYNQTIDMQVENNLGLPKNY